MRQSVAHSPATIVAQRRPASGAKQRPRGATIARTAAHHLRNVCARLVAVSSSSRNQARPVRWKSHSPKSSSSAQYIELSITDSACRNQLVVVSVQYGHFNPYIPIRSTTIGKSRVAKDPIAMHTSWRSNSDVASVTSIGYPRMSASGESSTTMHRLLHASGSHPIPPPNDPNLRIRSCSNCFACDLICSELIPPELNASELICSELF
ncbi:hypothetical protein F511_19257 [Dorcoceras hygrometricum]|uniref:Uncharacterized protein n=1 Tax=Dorcoceras hygrometricum TaxID=472368 RepID=A0A2Z7CRZ4_9LAMI|nr:hypothetical protein F511_19257 [Dorcoceras hygrometricum]